MNVHFFRERWVKERQNSLFDVEFLFAWGKNKWQFCSETRCWNWIFHFFFSRINLLLIPSFIVIRINLYAWRHLRLHIHIHIRSHALRLPVIIMVAHAHIDILLVLICPTGNHHGIPATTQMRAHTSRRWRYRVDVRSYYPIGCLFSPCNPSHSISSLLWLDF